MAGNRVSVVDTIDDLVIKLDRMAAAIPAAVPSATLASAQAIKAVTIPVIIAETPIGSGEGHDTSTSLAGSTTADVAFAGTEATILFKQPVRSKPSKNGGGGYWYAEAVIKGRDPITAPVGGSNGGGDWAGAPPAKALLTPWGYRKSVKASKPDNYPDRAMRSAIPAIAGALDASGRRLALEVVKGLTL